MSFALSALKLFLITIVPLVELRLAIPFGTLTGSVNLPVVGSISALGMNPLLVLFICVVSNFATGIVLFAVLRLFDGWLRKSRFQKSYNRLRARSHKRVEKFTKRYGTIGLALFIAIPLPGSGVYTGTVGAYVLGLSKKRFLIASAVGVTLAGVIVTLLTLGGVHIF